MKVTFVRAPSDAYDCIQKDPQAIKDYSNDWADWLAAAGGDTLNSSDWIVETGLTKVSAPAPTYQPTGLATCWLSGGTVGGGSTKTSLGMGYKVTNRITTTGGRSEDDTFIVVVTEK